MTHTSDSHLHHAAQLSTGLPAWPSSTPRHIIFVPLMKVSCFNLLSKHAFFKVAGREWNINLIQHVKQS